MQMERLTTKKGMLLELEPYFKSKKLIPIGVFIGAAAKAFKKLSVYENLGMTPDEVKQSVEELYQWKSLGYSPEEVQMAMSLAVSVLNRGSEMIPQSGNDQGGQ